MNSIYITGHTGFIGSYFVNQFTNYTYKFYQRGKDVVVNEDVVIHLAGKAHSTDNKKKAKEYYLSNTELTKYVFNQFLKSRAKVFIFISSVKAITDVTEVILTEEAPENPTTHYGKSKLQAEKYILSVPIPPDKRVYILRPCMIHGRGNKGNLNLLYSFVSKGLPWPLGVFNKKRSFCSIDNLLFILKELIERQDILSGVYNLADDEPLSTNEVISLIAASKNKKPKIWKIPSIFINTIAKIGDTFKLPLNSERLQKLTGSYIVSNNKIKNAIGKPLPLTSREGLLKTFKSFQS